MKQMVDERSRHAGSGRLPRGGAANVANAPRPADADRGRHDCRRVFCLRRENARRLARDREKSSASGSRSAGDEWLRAYQGDRLRPATRSASGPATSLRSRQYGAGMGVSPIWASSAPAASRPASIRPIRPRRSNIWSTIHAPACCSSRTTSSSTRCWQAALAARRSQRIVVFDMEGLSGFPIRWCSRFADFLAEGRAHIAGREDRWEEMIACRGAGRSCDPGLHLGHDRSAQGRDASPTATYVTQMRHANDLLSLYRRAKSVWSSCRSATSPNGSAATTTSHRDRRR